MTTDMNVKIWFFLFNFYAEQDFCLKNANLSRQKTLAFAHLILKAWIGSHILRKAIIISCRTRMKSHDIVSFLGCKFWK